MCPEWASRGLLHTVTQGSRLAECYHVVATQSGMENEDRDQRVAQGSSLSQPRSDEDSHFTGQR